MRKDIENKEYSNYNMIFFNKNNDWKYWFLGLTVCTSPQVNALDR